MTKISILSLFIILFTMNIGISSDNLIISEYSDVINYHSNMVDQTNISDKIISENTIDEESYFCDALGHTISGYLVIKKGWTADEAISAGEMATFVCEVWGGSYFLN